MQILIHIGWKLAEIVFLYEEVAAIFYLAAILDLSILDSVYPLGLAKRRCMQILIQIGWKLAEIFGFEDGEAILDLAAILDLVILDSGYPWGLT